ncbi:MAG: hypothetical protein ABIP03_00650 [Aquihabitans sp.]
MAYVIGLPRVDIEDRLPGQSVPLNSPGGAGKLGPLTVDTPLVAALPPQGDQSEQGEH